MFLRAGRPMTVAARRIWCPKKGEGLLYRAGKGGHKEAGKPMVDDQGSMADVVPGRGEGRDEELLAGLEP